MNYGSFDCLQEHNGTDVVCIGALLGQAFYDNRSSSKDNSIKGGSFTVERPKLNLNIC